MRTPGRTPSPLEWPLPGHGSTAAFSLLHRTRQRVEQHQHADHQLIIPVRGRLVFWVGEARAELQEPQGLFLTAGTPHSLEAPSGEVDLFAMQVAPAALAHAASSLTVEWAPLHLHPLPQHSGDPSGGPGRHPG